MPGPLEAGRSVVTVVPLLLRKAPWVAMCWPTYLTTSAHIHSQWVRMNESCRAPPG